MLMMAFNYAPFFLLFFHAIYQSLGSHMAEKESVCQRASAVFIRS
jgi:hypothetical protein